MGTFFESFEAGQSLVSGCTRGKVVVSYGVSASDLIFWVGALAATLCFIFLIAVRL
jgi:hypothetical protein